MKYVLRLLGIFSMALLLTMSSVALAQSTDKEEEGGNNDERQSEETQNDENQRGGLKQCAGLFADCITATAIALERLEACDDLRNCKATECGVEKRGCKIAAEDVRNTCLAACSSGRCKRECRRAFRTEKKECRFLKRDCTAGCREEHLTPECRAARAGQLDRFLAQLPKCVDYEKCAGELSLLAGK